MLHIVITVLYLDFQINKLNEGAHQSPPFETVYSVDEDGKDVATLQLMNSDASGIKSVRIVYF